MRGLVIVVCIWIVVIGPSWVLFDFFKELMVFFGACFFLLSMTLSAFGSTMRFAYLGPARGTAFFIC